MTHFIDSERLEKLRLTKVYISGPITGLTEEEYTENFARAEARLMSDGIEAVNPVKVQACLTEDCVRPDGTPGWQAQVKSDGSYLHDWRCYMKHDIISMMECDAILMIPGWTKSTGAQIELRIAELLKYEVFTLDPDYSTLRHFPSLGG